MSTVADEDLARDPAGVPDDRSRALSDLRVVTRRLEEVNRRLIASEALRSDFLSNVRNEVNNPLAAILGMSGEIASGNVRGSAEIVALARAIQGEAASLDFQMRNIFAAAEIEAGAALPVPARVDLRPLVEEVVAAFAPLAGVRGLSLLTHWETGPGSRESFTTDPGMLRLILANLVSNAVKFGAASVQVRLRRGSAALSVSVEDDGIGIAPDDREAIFERFRQLEGGRHKGYAGHGLGLSLVKALLDLLGGSVQVDGAPGPGCSFTVVIPESATAGSEDVFADAGNEYFFDA